TPDNHSRRRRVSAPYTCWSILARSSASQRHSSPSTTPRSWRYQPCSGAVRLPGSSLSMRHCCYDLAKRVQHEVDPSPERESHTHLACVILPRPCLTIINAISGLRALLLIQR